MRLIPYNTLRASLNQGWVFCNSAHCRNATIPYWKNLVYILSHNALGSFLFVWMPQDTPNVTYCILLTFNMLPWSQPMSPSQIRGRPMPLSTCFPNSVGKNHERHAYQPVLAGAGQWWSAQAGLWWWMWLSAGPSAGPGLGQLLAAGPEWSSTGRVLLESQPDGPPPTPMEKKVVRHSKLSLEHVFQQKCKQVWKKLVLEIYKC